jgi:hypothetical protein
LRVGRLHRSAKTLRSLHKPKSPALMRTSSTTGPSAKRTELTDPGSRARTLGVAPFGAPHCEFGRRHRKAGCVAGSRGPLFERIGGERPFRSDSNGFYEKAKFVKGRRGGCSQLPRTVTCAPLHLLLSALSVGRLLAARCMMRSVRTLQALQSKVRSLLRTKAICAVAEDRVFRAHVVSPCWLSLATLRRLSIVSQSSYSTCRRSTHRRSSNLLSS